MTVRPMHGEIPYSKNTWRALNLVNCLKVVMKFNFGDLYGLPFDPEALRSMLKPLSLRSQLPIRPLNSGV